MQKIIINDISHITGNSRMPIISKIKYWQKNDYELTIICPDEAKKIYEKHLSNINYILIPYASDAFNRIVLIFEYIKRNIISLCYINKVKDKFDIVYSISSVLDLLLFPFMLRYFDRKFRWCVVFDNIVPFNDERNRLISLLAYGFFKISLVLLKKADRIFVISEDLKQYLLKRNFNCRNVFVTGNGVEVDLIKKAQKNISYNIDALFIGRVNETKGIYDLIRVLQIVREKYPNFQLAIMGRGDETSEKIFKNKIIKNNLEKNIQFLGYKSGIEKYNIIMSSKLFLFLSPSESFGVALLEAVCCGLKAVVYELEPYKKIYLNNEVIMVTKNNYSKAADEVLKIIDRSDFENKKGKLLLNKYSWDVIAKKEYEAFI